MPTTDLCNAELIAHIKREMVETLAKILEFERVEVSAPYMKGYLETKTFSLRKYWEAME